MSARHIVGDARTVLPTLPRGSVDCLITSPPYPWQRSYLPPGHPDKARELGQESTPAEAVDALLDVMDLAWDVLTDDATFWLVLGDVHAGSGAAGGDYNEGGLRDGQERYDGTAKKAKNLRYAKAVSAHTNGEQPYPGRERWRGSREGWPLDQSVCWWPQIVGASMAYGRNLVNGTEHRQWVTRPPVTWCKPSAMPGRLDRRFKTSTELIVYGGKHQAHYFDLDSVRTPSDYHRPGSEHYARKGAGPGTKPSGTFHSVNEKGSPPLTWWEVGYSDEDREMEPAYWIVSHPGYTRAHFATFPPELLIRPVLAGCPAGGTILDPFAGTGVTAMVATGHGRNAVLIDLDERNLDLARERVGMWLESDTPAPGHPQPDASGLT